MEKKMTSGEIAKKVGISQKAVRLYDEKGLLKPSDYSEGNYRLYDKEAFVNYGWFSKLFHFERNSGLVITV